MVTWSVVSLEFGVDVDEAGWTNSPLIVFSSLINLTSVLDARENSRQISVLASPLSLDLGLNLFFSMINRVRVVSAEFSW